VRWRDAQPILEMKITDSGTGDIARPLFLSFGGEVAPGEPFAHMVPNRVLIAALLEAVRDRVEFFAPAEILGYAGPVLPSPSLTLRDGRQLAAPLIVAADGAQSAVRGMAASASLAPRLPPGGDRHHDFSPARAFWRAYEHFRPAGPFASLPLPRTQLVAGVDGNAGSGRTPQGDAARGGFGDRRGGDGSSLGTVTVEEPLQSFPLKLQIARAFVGSRLALIATRRMSSTRSPGRASTSGSRTWRRWQKR